ncbi:MAG TPA: phosphoglycerate dehydrogenase, partial [Bacteroidetes bacterium]|nr:phosphoglycerate dehydrogenase [Bacteroidota bacterium]
MQNPKYFIFDFDSTFVSAEGFDLLLEISLKKDKNKNEKISKIKEITKIGMNGVISIFDSLSLKVNL